MALQKLKRLIEGGTGEEVVRYQCLGCGVSFPGRSSADVSCPDCGSIRTRRVSE